MNLHRSPPRPWINTLPKYTSLAVSNSYYPGYRNDQLRFRTQRSVAASNLSSFLLCHTWRSAAKSHYTAHVVYTGRFILY